MQAQSIQEAWGHVPLTSKATGVGFPKPIRGHITSRYAHFYARYELQDLYMDELCSA